MWSFFELKVISLHLRKKDSTWNKWLNYSLKNDAEYDFATSKKKNRKNIISPYKMLDVRQLLTKQKIQRVNVS